MSTPQTDIFAKRLRQARKHLDLSQEELAREAKLPLGTISHFESGSRKPSFDNLRRLADALGITTDYLLGRVEDPGAVLKQTDPMYRNWHLLSKADQDMARDLVNALAKRRQKNREDENGD